MNGSGERAPANIKTAVAKDYKLLVDPILTATKEPKVYRYEGIVPGDAFSTVVVRDPRSRVTALSRRLDLLDLPVPRFHQIFSLS